LQGTTCVDALERGLLVREVRPPERGDGWDIAWVGSRRAYEYDPGTGILTQLTADHTYGQQLRDSLAERYRDRPQDLEDLAAGQDHVVAGSVATADDDTIGHVTTTGPRRRLLPTSDGVRKPVPRA
jgi:hypothetical protein